MTACGNGKFTVKKWAIDGHYLLDYESSNTQIAIHKEKGEDCDSRFKSTAVENIFSDKEEPKLKLLCCQICDKVEAIWHDGEWKSFDEIFRLACPVENTSGDITFKKVSSMDERTVLYVLSQLSHNQQELQQHASPFTLFAHDELATLCYSRDQAVGFYTLKERGANFNSECVDTFSMTMVDTVYVRASERRRGLGTRMLTHVMDAHPNQYIGFSEPLSSDMEHLLRKYLKHHPRMRDTVWLCSYTGEEGYRTNAWLELNSS